MNFNLKTNMTNRNFNWRESIFRFFGLDFMKHWVSTFTLTIFLGHNKFSILILRFILGIETRTDWISSSILRTRTRTVGPVSVMILDPFNWFRFDSRIFVRRAHPYLQHSLFHYNFTLF